MVGWIGAVRPSRRPLGGLLRMRGFLNAIKAFTLILRSAQKARLEGRKPVMQPFVPILAQPLTPNPLPMGGERVVHQA
jgi:hypothetical protein